MLGLLLVVVVIVVLIELGHYLLANNVILSFDIDIENGVLNIEICFYKSTLANVIDVRWVHLFLYNFLFDFDS